MEEVKQKQSSVSIQAALSRANALTFIVCLQDVLMRIGTGFIFVASLGSAHRSWVVLCLVVLGAIWMLSKVRFNGVIRQIENSFIARALELEETAQVTKWEHLSIMLGTRASATRADYFVNRILYLEPILLSGLFALFAILISFVSQIILAATSIGDG